MRLKKKKKKITETAHITGLHGSFDYVREVAPSCDPEFNSHPYKIQTTAEPGTLVRQELQRKHAPAPYLDLQGHDRGTFSCVFVCVF